jgi:DNA-binding NarL/FixJ family response regulator
MNLVLIEDNLNIQLALSQYFKNQSEFTNISVFNSAESYEAATLSHIPTIFLLDINTPKKSGTELIPIINAKHPSANILMFGVINDNDDVLISLNEDKGSYSGEKSLLDNIKETIIELNTNGTAVTKVIARKDFDFFNSKNTIAELLNSREKQIAAGLASGLSYKLIAFEYNISIDTVRKYIKSLYRKLKIHSKGELSFKYFQDKKF